MFKGKEDSFTFMAFYEDKSSEPIIVFYAPVGEAERISPRDRTFKPNAIFKMTVSDEDDNMSEDGLDGDRTGPSDLD